MPHEAGLKITWLVHEFLKRNGTVKGTHSFKLIRKAVLIHKTIAREARLPKILSECAVGTRGMSWSPSMLHGMQLSESKLCIPWKECVPGNSVS